MNKTKEVKNIVSIYLNCKQSKTTESIVLDKAQLIAYAQCKYNNELAITEEKLAYWQSDEVLAYLDEQINEHNATLNNASVAGQAEAEQPRKKRIIVVKKKQ